MGKLLLLFTVVPFVELYLLMQLAQSIGLVSTIGLVLGTGILGAALARQEGMRVIHSWQMALQKGRVPEEGVVNGLLILVGGVFLITPGVLTDMVGLSLLIPISRRWVSLWITQWVERSIQQGKIEVVSYTDVESYPFGRDIDHGRSNNQEVIDAEGETVEESIDGKAPSSNS